MSTGRLYSVSRSNVTYSGPMAVFFLYNSASTVFALRSFSIGGVSATVQSGKPQMIYYVTAAPTGGSAITPVPLIPGDPASSITALIGASAGGASNYALWRDGWQSENGYLWLPMDEDNPPIIGYSDGIALSLTTTPSPSFPINATAVFEELF